MKIDKVTAGNIGFMLGPRLNASGRLESALASFELLTTTDFMRAGQLAQQLDAQNRQRQSITRTMQEQAEAIAMREDPEAFLLFAAHEDFNPGRGGAGSLPLDRSLLSPGDRRGEKCRRDARLVPFHPRVPHHRRARSVQGSACPSWRSCRRSRLHCEESRTCQSWSHA